MSRKASEKSERKKHVSQRQVNQKPKNETVKKIDEECSVIVQIDEETEMMLKMISDSIRESIMESLKEFAPSQKQNSTDDDTSYEIGKLKNRIDDLEEKLDDINENIKQTRQKLEKMTTLLNLK